jgi:hypothetical protein
LVAGVKVDLPAILTRPSMSGYRLYREVMRSCEFPGIGVPVIIGGVKYISTLRMVPNARIYARYGRVCRISGYKKNNITRNWRLFTHELIEVFPRANMPIVDCTAWGVSCLLVIESANYAATKKDQHLIRAILLSWTLLAMIVARMRIKNAIILEWATNFAFAVGMVSINYV